MSNDKKIRGQIKTIATRGAKWKALVQSTAVDIALHVLEHGNVTLAADLVDAVSLNGGNYENLCKWLGEYAFVRVVNGEFKLNKAARDGALNPFGGYCDMARDEWAKEIAAGGMWYAEVETERKEKIERAFDSFAEADKFIARMMKSGDNQLASKIASLVAEYKESMKV